MAKAEKVLWVVLGGRSDANISFSDLCFLLEKLGFLKRIRGDHHIFFRDGIMEILNLQPKSGKAKPYQVKQVRNLILENKLEIEDGKA